jgi:DNA polymerase I-like protein with 3'-5' exonuclease and polymerase domains
MAMKITRAEWDQLDADVRGLQRFRAKAINFGLIYGISVNGFRVYAKTEYGVDYTEREAQQLHNGYFQKYSAIRPWHDREKAFAHEHGYVRSLHGATRHLPSIHSDDSAIRALCERQAVNAPIQRFGSDLGLIAFVRLTSQVDPNLMRPIAFIHDQLVCEVRDGYEEQGMGWLKWVMETPPLEQWFGITPPLPITSECEIGRNAGEIEERPDVVAIRPDWWQTEPWANAA